MDEARLKVQGQKGANSLITELLTQHRRVHSIGMGNENRRRQDDQKEVS
jgi:hypothetical protein